MPIDLPKLRALLTTEPGLHAILLVIERTRIRQDITTLANLRKHLDRVPGGDLTQLQLLTAFRLLESCGVGTLKDPTSRQRARFFWIAVPFIVATAALHEQLEILPQHYKKPAPPLETPDPTEDPQADWPTYTLPLRDGITITLRLPADLTKREAERLGHLLLAAARS